MTDDHFEIDATPEALDYLSEIATEMTLLFSIDREEAVGRINKLWGGKKPFRTEMQVSLLFHEEEGYWARRIYYRPDTKWWKEGEELVPRDYP